MLLAMLPFLQVHGFSFLNYDDPLHISSQSTVLSGLNTEGISWSVSATPSNLWHPLTWMSYMAEVTFLGGGADSPGVHHVGNLVLHLGATFFFFLLLRSLGISTLVAALVTLLFSVHPLHVEPVAWISSRKDVLCAFFSCVSLWSYSHSMKEREKNRTAVWAGVVLLALVAAVASKPSAVVLPGLFILLDYFPKGQALPADRRTVIRGVIQKWPYVLVVVIAATIAIAAQYSGSHSEFIERQGLGTRLSYLPATITFYVQHVLWPRGLTFDYASPQGTRYLILTIIGVLLLVGTSLFAWKYRKSHPVVTIAWLWFLICLAPVLGVFYVGGGFTADRYTYLALAGPALALAYGIDRLRGRLLAVGLTALTCVSILFGVWSYRQSQVWKNDAVLFSHGVATDPRSGTAQMNLASLYRQQGSDDLALVHYQKALKLEASHFIIHYNIAQIKLKRSEYQAAMESCRKSLRSNSGYIRSHALLAMLMEEHGAQPEVALYHFEKAHRLDPSNARTAISYALALARRKQYEEAFEVVQKNLQVGHLNPENRNEMEELARKLAPLAGHE